MSSSIAKFPPATRTRSTAALVFTRRDPPVSEHPVLLAPPVPASEEPQWSRAFALASGILLGLLVAGIWALLLLGDSLKR
jgi:hypothetical protein